MIASFEEEAAANETREQRRKRERHEQRLIDRNQCCHCERANKRSALLWKKTKQVK
jgi:hypothetical protein